MKLLTCENDVMLTHAMSFPSVYLAVSHLQQNTMQQTCAMRSTVCCRSDVMVLIKIINLEGSRPADRPLSYLHNDYWWWGEMLPEPILHCMMDQRWDRTGSNQSKPNQNPQSWRDQMQIQKYANKKNKLNAMQNFIHSVKAWIFY